MQIRRILRQRPGIEFLATGAVAGPEVGGADFGQPVLVLGCGFHELVEQRLRRCPFSCLRVDASDSDEVATFVLAGDKPGSKLDTARKLGVPVVDEAELRYQIL